MVALVFGEAALDLRFLRVGERQCFGLFGDAVPEILGELDSLGYAQLEKLIE